MGRWLAVRAVAWGLRGGVTDDEIERRMRSCLPHRGSAWRWEVIGDARLLNDRKQVRKDCRAQRRKIGA